MSLQARKLLALAVLALVMFGPVVLSAWLLWVVTGDNGQAALLVGVTGHLAPVIAALLLAFAAAATALRALWRGYLQRVRMLGERVQTMAGANPQARLDDDMPEEYRGIVHGANALADSRDALRAGIEERVLAARRSLEAERNRLAALMGELTQSVVVCNRDGRILLYNARARQQLRALSLAPEVADGGELVGLGRSIHAVFEPAAVRHAQSVIARQSQRGVAQPVASFICARGGALLRVRMSPVPQDERSASDDADGFILLFDDITDDFLNDRRRDRLVQSLTDEQRAELARLDAALGLLADGVSGREHVLAQARSGLDAIVRRIDEAGREFADTVRARWPLEDMQADDLLDAARARIQVRTGITVQVAGGADHWLRVDSFSMLQVLLFLSSRLVEAFSLRDLMLRCTGGEGVVVLELTWGGHAANTETLMSWQLDPLEIDGQESPLTVRDVLLRHGAGMTVWRDKTRHQCSLRLSLPAHAANEDERSLPQPHDSRPEYYDFDIFTWSEEAQGLDDRPLSALSYTAFDTETTGLDPSAGDEIIQIGATRIVNGKLLRGESFEQLIDPHRPLSAESVAVHGIRPEMLLGQPDVITVLPAFRAFVADTVLIAHNAAFDLRFLQLKEASTGVVFDRPVLDTLMLSAVLHPNQESHRLEDIAERLGVQVVGRHTALGDALVTAEVFIRMLPLLAERGIRTLGQAREASEQTYYARLKY